MGNVEWGVGNQERYLFPISHSTIPIPLSGNTLFDGVKIELL